MCWYYQMSIERRSEITRLLDFFEIRVIFKHIIRLILTIWSKPLNKPH